MDSRDESEVGPMDQPAPLGTPNGPMDQPPNGHHAPSGQPLTPTADAPPTGALGERVRMSGTELRLIRRAVRQGWPMTAEQRQALVDQVYRVAIHGQSEASQIRAAKTLVAMDAVNVSRERIETQAETADRTASAALARAALSTPEGRKALSALSQAQDQTPQPLPPPDPPILPSQ